MTGKVPLQAILLVAYLEADERKHFEGVQRDGANTQAHIYNSVKAVSDWLDMQPGMTTAAEREERRLKPLTDAFAAAGVTVVDGDFAEFWQWQRRRLVHNN